MKHKIIEIKNLYKRYGDSDDINVIALNNVNFNVHKGEFIAIMGPSGSGKSTLLNILSSIEEATSGTVLLDGEKTTRENVVDIRRYKTSIIYQDFNNLAYLSALENVMFPMMLAGTSIEVAKDTAKELLEKVQLGHRINHIPDDLSGGEQQRTAIARALVHKPKIVFADEPTGDLDTKTGASIMQLLRNLNKQEKTTLLAVTHDQELIKYADRHFTMVDGRLSGRG